MLGEKWALRGELNKPVGKSLKFCGVKFTGFNPYVFVDYDNDLKIELNYHPANGNFSDRISIFVSRTGTLGRKHIVAYNMKKWKVVKAYLKDLINLRKDPYHNCRLVDLWESQEKFNDLDLGKFQQYIREVRLNEVLNKKNDK